MLWCVFIQYNSVYTQFSYISAATMVKFLSFSLNGQKVISTYVPLAHKQVYTHIQMAAI